MNQHIKNNVVSPFIFLLFLVLIGLSFKDVIFFNKTKSAPQGIWILNRTQDLKVGDFVVSRIPSNKLYNLAHSRGYLNKNLLLKKVKAKIGDHLKITPEKVLINGKEISILAPRKIDSRYRNIQSFTMDRYLNENEFFLEGISENSFDSRYFGPIKKDHIKGRVTPIFVW